MKTESLPVLNPKVEERRILPEMTVREINARYPACGAVFARHGMGGCGGDLGPDEPLEFFAAAHHVDLCCLTAELERAAGEEVPDTISPALAFEKDLARVFKAFIRSAIGITLTFGTAWGAYILVKISQHQSFSAPDYAGTQAHGHAQIYGWVGMFIMGVAYFSVPKFMQSRMRTLAPAWAAFAFMLAGVLLRAIAQPLASRPAFGGLVLASAILELAAVIIFATDLGLVFARSRQPGQGFHAFIYASLAALVGLAAWNLALVIPLWREHTRVIPEPANGSFLYLAVFGFTANMILGYSLRLLPIFLGLRPTRKPLVVPAFVLFNFGLLARLLDQPLVSGALGFAGMGLYVFALRVFEPPASYVKSRGVDESFPWFVRLAYAWFVVATAMVLGGDVYRYITGALPPHIYVGAWRHAITVGFITTLMVGLGYRMLPLFMGVDLWRPDWMRVSFWLLAAGNTMRVAFQLLTATGERGAYLLMGSSGALELSALALFGVSIWKTLGRRQQVLYTEEQITPRTHLRWLLDNFPEAREELIRAGLHHLKNVPTVPSFVTLEQAASIHGLDANALAERLRALLRPKALRPAPQQPPGLVEIGNQIHKAS